MFWAGFELSELTNPICFYGYEQFYAVYTNKQRFDIIGNNELLLRITG